MQTRKGNSRLTILGTLPRPDENVIAGARLPTHRQVLNCFIVNLEELRKEDNSKQKNVRHEAAFIVMNEILKHYDKGRIPVIQQHKIREKVQLLYTEFKGLLKLNRNRRHRENKKLAEFQEKLEKTMPFWPKEVVEVMAKSRRGKSDIEKQAIDNDIKFLESMMTDRVASYGNIDIIATQKEDNRRKRRFDELIRSEGKLEESEDIRLYEDDHIDQDSNESSNEQEHDDDQVVPSVVASTRPHRRHVKRGTPVFVPHDILRNRDVVATAVRNKISPTALSATVRTVIQVCGGDNAAVSIHPSTSYRHRVHASEEIANNIKSKWIPPAIASIHWDGKLMTGLDTNRSEERLPVVISGEGKAKLLGVPKLPHDLRQRAGQVIADATCDLLQEWKCTDIVRCMVFDTTSANTGHVSAACISIQQQLGRQLLWCACRHHIGEIMLTHVWNDLKIEVSKSPEIVIFKKFRASFGQIKHDANGAYLTRSEIPLPQILSFCKQKLDEESVRSDYKELLELTVVYLDIDGSSKYTIHRPGAIHKARWMAKNIYAIKIVLLKNVIPRNIISAAQMGKLRRYVDFVVQCYIQWWFTAPTPQDAPLNDLNLRKSLEMFEDEVIRRSAIKAFANHTWYLTEELLPLALFSDKVSLEEKMAIVQKLEPAEAFENRHGYGLGKPILPKVTALCSLSDFVGTSSWHFFDLMDINTCFLTLPVEAWHLSAAYIEAQQRIRLMLVVNDAAERGVKLASDVLDCARKETRYQATLQVTENHRSEHPNQKKRKVHSIE